MIKSCFFSLAIIFFIVLLAGLISVTGGNGLIIMPSLLMFGYDIKEIMLLVRASAVVFVFYNVVGMIADKNKISFKKQDLIITITTCASVLLSIRTLGSE
ncbi:hypothetical protein IB643_01945 [Allofrancisella guangzhouensis]|uniref:hypothetical protein n=1 Tax=Allofrancisella guangzhouensis TaxID=594679 RepID=UPI001903290D|nr:hypothetical protein [Allofrancisella guangzhouensis]MBK2026919.1 hypothetical protein [Allofrancisella guangzhouensis]